MGNKKQDLKFPWETVLKRTGIYYMTKDSFDECMEGKFVFIGNHKNPVERILPGFKARFHEFINRAGISITEKNGFAIIKKS